MFVSGVLTYDLVEQWICRNTCLRETECVRILWNQVNCSLQSCRERKNRIRDVTGGVRFNFVGVVGF